MTNNMGRAGIPDRARIKAQSVAADEYVARVLGGWLNDDPYDPVVDVWLASGEGVQVKSVPAEGWGYVLAGNHRPLCRVVVVERDHGLYQIVGEIACDAEWRFGRPFGDHDHWYVGRSSVAPVADEASLRLTRRERHRMDEAPRRSHEAEKQDEGASDTRPRFGDPLPMLDRADVRRAQWREAGARRRARWREHPVGWAFPDDPPRGLGDNPGTGRKPVVRRDE